MASVVSIRARSANGFDKRSEPGVSLWSYMVVVRLDEREFMCASGGRVIPSPMAILVEPKLARELRLIRELRLTLELRAVVTVRITWHSG